MQFLTPRALKIFPINVTPRVLPTSHRGMLNEAV